VLATRLPTEKVLASHCHERLYTLEANVDRRIGMDRGEKGIRDIEKGFPLFEILKLRMYSLESFESRCVGVYFSFASYSFYRLKVA